VCAVAAPVFVGDEAMAALGASGPNLEVEAVGERVVALAAELGEAMAESDG
jgi:DNA-binding IclR family transcriptional regulator